MATDHFFFFLFFKNTEFLGGIQVHHWQLTIKCMGGMGRAFIHKEESNREAEARGRVSRTS